MLDYKVKIGIIAMRRNTTDRPRSASWNWHSPQEREKEIVAYIENNFSNSNVEFVNTKGLGIGNLIFDNASAKQAIERMQREKVDAIVIVNCNFGNEEAAGDIALALGKPVLLWAPLDEEYSEDGTRTTDSQCGLFGVSRQLQRLHIPFSNIPSCRVDSEEFETGFSRFIRVACMVKNFKGMRIGQVGTRPTPFYSVIYNESELLEKSRNGDLGARNKLIEHNLRLVAHIVKKYYANSSNQDDLISIGTIGLIKAVSTFKSDKNIRLATYASRCIENEILMYFRNQKKSAQDVYISDPIDTDKEGNSLTLIDVIADKSDIVEELDTKLKLEKLKTIISDVLDQREFEIIELRYGLGNKPELTQREIAKKLNISRSYVSRIEKSALEKLRQQF